MPFMNHSKKKIPEKAFALQMKRMLTCFVPWITNLSTNKSTSGGPSTRIFTLEGLTVMICRWSKASFQAVHVMVLLWRSLLPETIKLNRVSTSDELPMRRRNDLTWSVITFPISSVQISSAGGFALEMQTSLVVILNTIVATTPLRISGSLGGAKTVSLASRDRMRDESGNVWNEFVRQKSEIYNLRLLPIWTW